MQNASEAIECLLLKLMDAILWDDVMMGGSLGKGLFGFSGISSLVSFGFARLATNAWVHLLMAPNLCLRVGSVQSFIWSITLLSPKRLKNSSRLECGCAERQHAGFRGLMLS